MRTAHRLRLSIVGGLIALLALMLTPVFATASPIAPVTTEVPDFTGEPPAPTLVSPVVPVIGAPADFQVTATSCLAQPTASHCPGFSGIAVRLPASPLTSEAGLDFLTNVAGWLATGSGCYGTAQYNTCDGLDLDEVVDAVNDALDAPGGDPVCVIGTSPCTTADLVEAIENIKDDLGPDVGEIEDLVARLVPDTTCDECLDVTIATLLNVVAYEAAEFDEWAPESDPNGVVGPFIGVPGTPLGTSVDTNVNTATRNGPCNFWANPVEAETGANGTESVFTSSGQSCPGVCRHGIDVYLQRYESDGGGGWYWSNKASGSDSHCHSGPQYGVYDSVHLSYNCFHKKLRWYRNHTDSWRNAGGGTYVYKAADSPNRQHSCSAPQHAAEFVPPLS